MRLDAGAYELLKMVWLDQGFHCLQFHVSSWQPSYCASKSFLIQRFTVGWVQYWHVALAINGHVIEGVWAAALANQDLQLFENDAICSKCDEERSSTGQ